MIVQWGEFPSSRSIILEIYGELFAWAIFFAGFAFLMLLVFVSVDQS